MRSGFSESCTRNPWSCSAVQPGLCHCPLLSVFVMLSSSHICSGGSGPAQQLRDVAFIICGIMEKETSASQVPRPRVRMGEMPWVCSHFGVSTFFSAVAFNPFAWALQDERFYKLRTNRCFAAPQGTAFKFCSQRHHCSSLAEAFESLVSDQN